MSDTHTHTYTDTDRQTDTGAHTQTHITTRLHSAKGTDVVWQYASTHTASQRPYSQARVTWVCLCLERVFTCVCVVGGEHTLVCVCHVQRLTRTSGVPLQLITYLTNDIVHVCVCVCMCVYTEIDKDKSGTITVDEFAAALRKKGQLIGDGDIKRIMEVRA